MTLLSGMIGIYIYVESKESKLMYIAWRVIRLHDINTLIEIEFPISNLNRLS